MPDGWAWARLGNIGEIITGGTPSKSHHEYYGNAFPFFKPADLDQGRKTIISSEYLSEKGKSCCRIIPKFSTAVCCIGSIGKCGYLNVEGTTNQQINSVIPNIDSLYAYYYCSSDYFLEQLLSLASATTIAIVNKSKMESVLIPVPPMVEQQRIANTLDTALGLIETLEVEKSDIIVAINNVKSKILDLAIRGKLVPQDPNDEPASVLLERIRAEKEELIKQGKIKRDKKESVIFKGDDNSYYQDLPQNWQVSTLREVTTPLTLNDGDWILSENMTDNGEVKLLQLGSIGNMSYIDKGFKYLTKDTFDELSCTEIFAGYLIINRIISDKMCCCIVPDIDGTIITTVDTCWIAPSETSYDIKFLMYQLASPSFQSAVLLKATGTTRKRISKNNLIDLHLLLPPLAEQRRIVHTIEALFAQIDKISEQIS